MRKFAPFRRKQTMEDNFWDADVGLPVEERVRFATVKVVWLERVVATAKGWAEKNRT